MAQAGLCLPPSTVMMLIVSPSPGTWPTASAHASRSYLPVSAAQDRAAELTSSLGLSPAGAS